MNPARCEDFKPKTFLLDIAEKNGGIHINEATAGIKPFANVVRHWSNKNSNRFSSNCSKHLPEECSVMFNYCCLSKLQER